MWQRLVEEHGAEVGESTVRRYVAEVRARQEVPLVEVMVPQRHPLGEEAEVDFGTATVFLAGLLTEVQLFIMRLSASGRAYPRAYLNEAQEVFLDGHVRAFEHFGGVPGRIRYDNLKAAVAKVLRGRDRVESERFVALRSHYGFDSFFCQPGVKGAHEKGGVEGEVGRFRRRHLVPVPKVASMAELNEALLAARRQDDRRFIAGRRITRRRALRPRGGGCGRCRPSLSTTRRSAAHRVDRKARVSVAGRLYSVPARYRGRRLDVRVGAETIEVLDGAKVVARHPRSLKARRTWCSTTTSRCWRSNPGPARGHRPGPGPGSGAFTQPTNASGPRPAGAGRPDGTRALIEVLLLHRTMPADAVIAGMEPALAAGSTTRPWWPSKPAARQRAARCWCRSARACPASTGPSRRRPIRPATGGSG